MNKWMNEVLFQTGEITKCLNKKMEKTYDIENNIKGYDSRYFNFTRDLNSSFQHLQLEMTASRSLGDTLQTGRDSKFLGLSFRNSCRAHTINNVDVF